MLTTLISGRYLGEIIPKWGLDNKLAACKGKYHELDNSVPSDPTIEKMIQGWPIKDGADKIGTALNDFDRIGRFGPPTGPAECLLGNFIAEYVFFILPSDLLITTQDFSQTV